MNSLEMMLLQPIFNYLLDVLEKKYGNRIIQLEQQVENLLSAHTENSNKTP